MTPQQPSDQNQQSFRPSQQHFDLNQQFRPPWKHQQQFRPRPPKDLEYRNWQYANPGPPPECERFTILSYNILGDSLARDHWDKLYFHIPRHFLDWERRKRSILFELGLWSADVICLQEVDRFQDLKEELELRGYSGIWKMRTGDPVDGCAIFWRNCRFKLLYEESIEFCKLGLRDNIAQICVFESLDQCMNRNTSAFTSLHQAKKLVVCNIHVLFNPKRGEIKLGQVRVLLSRAHAISKLWDDAPLVLCGDFNSTPKSPLYNFIAEQKLDLSELPRDKVSGQASAKVHVSRPFNARYGAHSTENSAQAVPAQAVPDFSNGSQVSEDNASLISEDTPSVGLGQDMVNDLPLQESCHKDVHCPETMSNASEFSSVGEPPCNSIDAPESKGISSLGVPTKPPSSCQSSHSLEESLESTGNLLSTLAVHEKSCISISYGSSVCSDLSESSNSNCQFDEEIDSLSLKKELEDTKECQSAGEDDLTFLSELHHGSSFPSLACQFKELDESAKEITSLDSQEFLSLGKENSDDTPGLNGEENTVEKSKYDPSAWTPAEIETATGSSDCMVMEHALKLQSVYGEIKDSLGTRDSSGEPVATSYHRRFMGTVDYIWRSEGLQASRVLAPIPKHAMLWTKGFPTKKWGSDHIALVSELAFLGHDSTQNNGTL